VVAVVDESLGDVFDADAGAILERPEVEDALMGDKAAAAFVEIGELFNGPFAKRRPRLAYTLEIREKPLRVLHAQQIALLKTWRAHSAAQQTEASEAILPDLLLSINALASGLRTTG
jgi:phosphoenolpyruvate carboxylase